MQLERSLRHGSPPKYALKNAAKGGSCSFVSSEGSLFLGGDTCPKSKITACYRILRARSNNAGDFGFTELLPLSLALKGLIF